VNQYFHINKLITTKNIKLPNHVISIFDSWLTIPALSSTVDTFKTLAELLCLSSLPTCTLHTISSNKSACSSFKFIPPADAALQIHNGSTITQQQQQQHHNITTQPETLYIQEETIHTSCPGIFNSVATQSFHDDSHTNKHIGNDSSS
jgi:hypothetical protein